MKSFYALAVAGLVAVASAQLDSLPPCALTCLTKGLPKTGCDLTDFKCACENKPFISESTACIQKGCSADEQQAAIDGAKGLCKSAGVDIDLPSPGSGASSTAAPSSSAAPSAPAPSSAPATAAPSSAPLESMPSVAPTATASSSIAESTVAMPSPSSGNGTGNGSYVPPQNTVPESGSGRLTAGLSAVVLAVAGVLAF